VVSGWTKPQKLYFQNERSTPPDSSDTRRSTTSPSKLAAVVAYRLAS
jgi:hypothetical protein